MKLIIATCLLALGLAAPPQEANFDSKKAEILEYSYENNGLGRYHFSYEQSDGTKHNQNSKVVDGHIVVKGRYTFIGQDGVIYSVSYIADENGYQATFDETNPEKEEAPKQIYGMPLEPGKPSMPFFPSLLASSLG